MTAVRTLGGTIREVRNSHGMSLTQLAKDTGVSLSDLSNIENGRKGLSLTTALRVSRALGLRVEDIAVLAEANPEAPVPAGAGAR